MKAFEGVMWVEPNLPLQKSYKVASLSPTDPLENDLKPNSAMMGGVQKAKYNQKLSGKKEKKMPERKRGRKSFTFSLS